MSKDSMNRKRVLILDLSDPVEASLGQAIDFHRINRLDLHERIDEVEGVKRALALPNARTEEHLAAVDVAIFGSSEVLGPLPA